ncbi:hypothetical protein BaRGS_00001792 [Batillaria attramentaria]|uniref:Uncharacterized protein n=1 Tax=Batillaria attramentaria TaxID=370345 RepID=A0ABD0M6F2_9CAEN
MASREHLATRKPSLENASCAKSAADQASKVKYLGRMVFRADDCVLQLPRKPLFCSLAPGLRRHCRHLERIFPPRAEVLILQFGSLPPHAVPRNVRPPDVPPTLRRKIPLRSGYLSDNRHRGFRACF